MLNVAKSLASHDVSIRNKGVQMVENWLRTTTPTPVEMQKTWGALFYCMWHSDKPLVQHELAQRLAKSQYLLTETPLRFQWIRAFWDVHTTKWTGIDKHRLDKYYALLRYFVHETLRILYKMDWDKESLDLHIQVLCELPLSSSAPRGIIFHLSDLYVEELQKVLEDTPLHTLQSEIFLALLEPFFNLMKTGDKFILKRVSESVFTGLLDRWTELLDPSDESNKTNDFEQRQDYILNLITELSQKLLTLSTSMDIPSPNRTAFYEARVGFEEILGELGKDLKKRKIEDSESNQPEQKRKIDQNQAVPVLSAEKEQQVSSETSSDEEGDEDEEVDDEVNDTAELAEGAEIDVGGESEDESESGDEESDEEPVVVPEPQPKVTPVAVPNKQAPKSTPQTQEPKKVETTSKPATKPNPSASPQTTATIKNKTSPSQTVPKSTPAAAVTKKQPASTVQTGTSSKPKPTTIGKPPAVVPQRTAAKDTPTPAPVPAVAAKGRPSATLQEQPKQLKKSPIATKKDEKKKVIFNLEKNKSVDLNEFQFDSNNRPHRPHAQPKTGILKTTIPTHNPIKRNKFNQNTKKQAK